MRPIYVHIIICASEYRIIYIWSISYVEGNVHLTSLYIDCQDNRRAKIYIYMLYLYVFFYIKRISNIFIIKKSKDLVENYG